MAKNYFWQDDYWLFVLQLYLQKPAGMKPLYSKPLVDLSMELHIPPQMLHDRLRQVANLETPRIERYWQQYAESPQRLRRAVRLLREMTGFNSGGGFFDGVEVEETFERDFRPLPEDERLTPTMLTIILSLYFQLTPQTMVKETPEVQQTARLMRVDTALIVDVLEVFQHCDPYLNRRDVTFSPLLMPCQQIWQRYANGDINQLAAHADELAEYFKG